MRQSSSPSEPGLFDEISARGAVREAVSDAAWLRAMLEVESALAAAQAEAGLIPAGHAAAIADACQPFDIGALARGAAEAGNPVYPLVLAIRARVSAGVAASVHKGATSQDILDTAAMLVADRCLGVLLDDVAGAVSAANRLSREHGDVPMSGRTLLQRAEPVTFGHTCAMWVAGLEEAAKRLIEIRRSRLTVQFGGAVGLGEALPSLAVRLGLADADLPWHTNRVRVAELASALGVACGAIGKVARDVTLLAQTEVGEVEEGTPGPSSAMPHKRNPVAAICALASAMQAPGLVGTVLAAMVQEHGRAAGAWHAEWRPIRELLLCTGSAAAWLRQSLGGLRVNAGAMAAKLSRPGGQDEP